MKTMKTKKEIESRIHELDCQIDKLHIDHMIVDGERFSLKKQLLKLDLEDFSNYLGEIGCPEDMATLWSEFKREIMIYRALKLFEVEKWEMYETAVGYMNR